MFDKTFNWSKNIRDKSAFRLMGPADYETFLKISKNLKQNDKRPASDLIRVLYKVDTVF